jgi:hypothetical protein
MAGLFKMIRSVMEDGGAMLTLGEPKPIGEAEMEHFERARRVAGAIHDLVWRDPRLKDLKPGQLDEAMALRHELWDTEAQLVTAEYHKAREAGDVERALDIRDYLRSIDRDVI